METKFFTVDRARMPGLLFYNKKKQKSLFGHKPQETLNYSRCYFLFITTNKTKR